MSWINSLNQTIGNGVNAITGFFQSAWSSLLDFLSFGKDLIEGLAYGFNTVIRVGYEGLNKITFYDYFTTKDNVFSVFDGLLGSPTTQFLSVLLLLSVSLVVVRFVYSLIPFFKSGRSGS